MATSSFWCIHKLSEHASELVTTSPLKLPPPSAAPEASSSITSQ